MGGFFSGFGVFALLLLIAAGAGAVWWYRRKAAAPAEPFLSSRERQARWEERLNTQTRARDADATIPPAPPVKPPIP